MPRAARSRAIILREGPGGAEVALIERRRGGRLYYVFPGGGIEPGESPEAAAARELVEETGIRARLTALGMHELSTAMFPSRQHLFLARVESFGEPQLEPFERHTIRGLRRLPLAEAVELVLRGEIRGLSSVSLVLKANEHLRRGELRGARGE